MILHDAQRLSSGTRLMLRSLRWKPLSNMTLAEAAAQVLDQKRLGWRSAKHAQRGVGALIQRGGRAVAGMLPIATAGGS